MTTPEPTAAPAAQTPDGLREATAIVRELFRRGCSNPPPMRITLDVRDCGKCADCTRDWTPEARAIVAPVLAALPGPTDETRAEDVTSPAEPSTTPSPSAEHHHAGSADGDAAGTGLDSLLARPAPCTCTWHEHADDPRCPVHYPAPEPRLDPGRYICDDEPVRVTCPNCRTWWSAPDVTDCPECGRSILCAAGCGDHA